MKTNESGFGRLALLALGIPILILAVVGSHTLSRFEENADKLRFAAIERDLDSTVAATSENAYLLDGLRKRLAALRQSEFDMGETEKACRRLSRLDGLGIRLYLYEHNRLMNMVPKGRHTPLFTKLMEQLHAKGDAFLDGQRAVMDDLMAFFGPGSRLELLKRNKGLLVRFGRPGKNRGAYFWNDWGGGRSFFATVYRIPEAQDRFRRIQRGSTAMRAGFAIPQRDIWLPPVPASIDEMRAAWAKSRLEGRLQTRSAGREWIFCQSHQGLIWCLADRVPDGSSAPWIRGFVILATVISFILLVLWILASFSIKPGPGAILLIETLPLRIRLTALFLMATVLPLGLALILGGIGVMDRTEVIATESDRQALGRLHRYEHAYVPFLERFRENAERLRDWPPMKEGRIELLRPLAEKLQERNILQDIEIRDDQARAIFTTIDPVVKGSNQAIDMFSRTALRRHAPSRGVTHADKVSANELVGEAILSSDDIGLASMLRARGKVWTFKMGTNPTLWFWDVYADQATGPAFFCMTHQLEWIYGASLRTLTSRSAVPSAPRPAAMRFCPDTASDLLRPRLKGADHAALRSAIIRSQESGRVLTRALRLDDGVYWAVIKPETVLGVYVLVDLVPVSEQLRALAPFRKRLELTAGLALLLSLLGASLISSLFLVPISDLGEGINAIRRRDSAFRIPLRRPDEFGAVAAAFNKLLSEFEELEYGRIVQESLLPSAPKAPEGYEISTYRRSATDLAGDYHDVVTLDDGNVAIVLGDVTGHGIAAALPMAMAKATVEYEIISHWGYPGPLMGRLNALFNRELKPRQKFMTMACILLDPVRHTITYDNAGHPYPLLYNNIDNTSLEIPLPSMPLGIRASRTSKPVRKELAPGDAVLLYTDGLVECSGRENGEPFGYDTLQRLFGRLCATPGLTGAGILEKIAGALDAWKEEGPLADDVTLLVLRRRETGITKK